jgi:hypothetical protein
MAHGLATKAPEEPLNTPSPLDASEVIEFFHQVDQCIRRVLRGESSPLVLACVGYLALLYRSANTYPHLIGCKIPGSPDRWSMVELQKNAWRLVAPYLADASQRLLARPPQQTAAALADNGRSADRVEISFERPTSHPSAPTNLFVADEPGSSWTPIAR